ncbi:MAG: trimethylamine methyltransferase family protein, partial [Actinobacteria bacterium]|nr:trimethylamine methyltransferase family protein [Actinomycetota bacterium]
MQLENMKVLNEKEIELIHENSIEILKRSGIEILSSKVAEMLNQYGCMVENKPEGFLVKFDSDLVTRSLSKCPEDINLYNRDGSNSFKLSQDKINFGSGHNAIFVQDYDTNIRR